MNLNSGTFGGAGGEWDNVLLCRLSEPEACYIDRVALKLMVMLLPLTLPCLMCKVNLQASRVEWYLPGMEWVRLGLCGSQSLIQAGRVRFLRCVAWKEVGVNASMLYISTLFKCGDKTLSLWKNKDEGDGYVIYLHLFYIYTVITCRMSPRKYIPLLFVD